MCNIDVLQGSITVPGTLSAMHVPRPVDIESGFRDLGAVLSHYFGYETPSANVDLYRKLLDLLMENVTQRFAQSTSGVSGSRMRLPDTDHFYSGYIGIRT
jgi:polyribonucleotide 5'-hydroxyl-kinase